MRLEAIAELGDALELAALAEHDPDPKVRLAAVAKVDEPTVLGRVASSDGERAVRDAAGDRLLELAVDPSHSGAATAAELLSDVRRVSSIAKSAAADVVREIALAKLTDERALGGVARHATVESTALAAAARLTSADELLATVLNSEHREVALAVFERVVSGGPTAGADVGLLETIEARTQQKAVARRARAMRQEIEDAEHARRVAEEERRKQETALCVGVESLTDVTDPDRAAAELAHLTASWSALTGADAAAALRFAAGVDAVRLRLTKRRGEIEAERELARRRDEALASHEALYRRVQSIEGDSTLEQLDAVEAEWGQLPPVVGYERDVAQLEIRFGQAVSACRERHALGTQLEAAHAALEALVVEAEALPAQETKAASTRWRALSRETRTLAATLSAASRPVSDLLDRLAVVAQTIEARATAAREAAAKATLDQAAKLARLAARASRAADAETMTLREGDRLLRDLTTALANADTGETAREIAEAMTTLRPLQERLVRRVKELRDMDEWRRFANVQQQEELIAMAEAIVASLKAEEEAGADSDLAATAKALRELQSRWQEVADAPQHSAKRLWERFKAAIDFIRSRCEVHFAQLRQERSANLAAKAALIEEAETLAGSTDWSKTAARLQEMQKAWDEIGAVPGDAARTLAQRFRAACNAFFTRRRDALSSKKQEWNENMARKEALCERAEQLAESTEWDAAASEVKKLQAEWKAVGPVRHDKSEAVWNRFRSAADTFFDRYHNRHKAAAAEKVAEHAALVVALEELVALEEAPADLAAQVQTLRTTIAGAPHVEGAEMKALHERWTAALAALVARWPAAFAGTDLDPVAIRERMEKLITKVEHLVRADAPVAVSDKSATELLAERLRSALANNAMGVRPDETKWRAASKTVEEAQEAWRRIVRVPSEDVRALEERFRTACTRVMDQVKQHVPVSSGGSDGGGHGRGRDRGGREHAGGRGGPKGRRSARGSASDAGEERGRAHPGHAKTR